MTVTVGVANVSHLPARRRLHEYSFIVRGLAQPTATAARCSVYECRVNTRRSLQRVYTHTTDCVALRLTYIA